MLEIETSRFRSRRSDYSAAARFLFLFHTDASSRVTGRIELEFQFYYFI
jgi:hypothetical protein